MVSLTCPLASKTESEVCAAFYYRYLAKMLCRGSWPDSDAWETWRASGGSDESEIWNGQRMMSGGVVVEAGSSSGSRTATGDGVGWVSEIA